MQHDAGHPRNRSAAAGLARRLGAWLCLMLLAANVLGSAVLPSRSALASNLPDGAMVVCTAAGLKIIDPSGQTPPASAAEQGGLCALCLPLVHGAVAAPDAAVLPAAPAAMADTLPAAATQRAPDTVLSRHAPPRAPPAI